MEIHSAFNSGVQGFQKATEDANQAAQNIAANATRPENFGIGQEGATQAISASNQASPQTSAQTKNNAVSLTQSIVDLRVAEFQAKASGEVISSADDNLGTLLDVRV